MPELDPAAVIDAVAGHPQLRVFVGADRIETMPARQARRRQLLDVIAQAFEPGVRYPEPRVNQFLGAIYPDHATLRRYLVDEQFLSRAGGEYWRSGGTVPPATGPQPPLQPGGGGR
jgi:hypothetical protein